MQEKEKEIVRETLNKYDNYEISFLENKEKGKRNGLIKVDIKHESQTMPNERLIEMLEIGYTVSCIVGGMNENDETSVYFEQIKGTI